MCLNSPVVAAASFDSDRKPFFWDSSKFLELLPSKPFSLDLTAREWLIVNHNVLSCVVATE